MDDRSAQSSQKQYGDEQQTNGNQTNQQVPQSQPSAPVASSPQQPVSSVPHKEHAPLTEHVKVSDPVESQPELHAEVKEFGMDAKQDEAHLELTRQQQKLGMSHSPSSLPVTPHVNEEKPEFSMTDEEVTTNLKAPVWNPIRWFATLIRKEKDKKLLEIK